MIKQYISKSMLYEDFGLGCNVSEFSRFGVGLLLYFRFMQSLSWIFLAMFCFSLPAIIQNYNANGLSENDSPFYTLLRTTLANQERFSPKYDSSTNSTINLYYAVNGYKDNYLFNIENNHFLLVTCDISYTIIFIIFIVWLHH